MRKFDELHELKKLKETKNNFWWKNIKKKIDLWHGYQDKNEERGNEHEEGEYEMEEF